MKPNRAGSKMDRVNCINKIARWSFLSLLILILIPGCAGKKRVEKDPSLNKWKVKAETSKGFSPSAKKRSADLTEKKEAPIPDQTEKTEPEIETAEPEKQLPTDKITMKMHDIDVVVLLRALARAANQNIMVNEKVKGKASINIKEAPWDHVFRGLLRTHGLTYAWEGDIIRILTAEDLEQDLKRESQKRGLQLAEPFLTRIIRINYGKADKLRENLETFLTANTDGKPLGSVMVDEHTNSLIIQAISGDIERMIPIIEELDRPTPQIRIEAHIVEATKSTARDLGIQWGGLYQTTNSDGVNQYITPGAATATAGTVPNSGNIVNFPAALVPGGAGLTLGYVLEEVGKNILTVQLSALQEEGKLNILSSPSITTLDNQKATIEAGKEVPYQTVEDGDVKIEFKDAVLLLEVTPHVIDGKTLTLKIYTKNDELDFTTPLASGQPTITTKKAETNVVLLDGQTTVIGGLSKEKVDDSESGVPWLKDIPILGYLFKGTSKKNTMDDLLIFITPHILKERVFDERNAEIHKSIPLESASQPETVPE
ncbi:type IV pilus secretin PilQ [Thermodesulfobacteriota bacterium]